MILFIRLSSIYPVSAPTFLFSAGTRCFRLRMSVFLLVAGFPKMTFPNHRESSFPAWLIRPCVCWSRLWTSAPSPRQCWGCRSTAESTAGRRPALLFCWRSKIPPLSFWELWRISGFSFRLERPLFCWIFRSRVWLAQNSGWQFWKKE